MTAAHPHAGGRLQPDLVLDIVQGSNAPILFAARQGNLEAASNLVAGGAHVNSTAATKLDVSRPTIAKWRRRFLEHGVEGLTSQYPGRAPWKLTARVRARVLAATRRPPPDGTTHLHALDQVLRQTEVGGKAAAGPARS